MDDAMGIMTPHSFVPHPATKYDKNMTYFQRCYNTLLYVYEAAVRKFSYMPAQNKLAKKYFRDAFDGEIPNLLSVEKNISVMLSNTHRLTNTRPKMSAQVDIAGAHLKEPSQLKSELQVFKNIGQILIDKILMTNNFLGHYHKLKTQRHLFLTRIVFETIANAERKAQSNFGDF